ncbi:M15 family metallopeptidase [Micrococcus luteus]|uniref:M15 family metallopeptidase n=1 Tax=Micrococcus luteus TaxID=1270 RepID=UPI00352CADE9|nr:M15 family metallopeptidase [Micrococcus luteus]
MRRPLPLAALAALALLAAGCGTPAAGPSSATPASGSSSAAASSGAASSTHADPAALDVVVNKTRPVAPPDWAPSDLVAVPGSELPLRAEAATAAGDLLDAAAAAGHDLTTLSAYRSYDYQVRTYGHWVDELGRAEADRVSARPGYSEHQTGLAWDVGDAATPACDLEVCFGDTAAGRWVAARAAEYGFVIRYPAGAEDVTGFDHEPWHLRYVGSAEAARVEAAGGVLETAWGLPPAPDYAD